MIELTSLMRELTPRECAVLRSLESGAAMKAIAFDLGISVPSVKTFAQRAYRKLGVGRAADAVRRHKRLPGHACGDVIRKAEAG